jgi:hypothetical protein
VIVVTKIIQAHVSVAAVLLVEPAEKNTGIEVFFEFTRKSQDIGTTHANVAKFF